MLEIHSQALLLERATHDVEIQMRVLGNMHTQLNNINTQATLVVGFALATLGADFLSQVGSHTGEFCAFNSAVHEAVGGLLILLVTLCIGISVVVTSCASYLLQKSHEAALRIGAAAAVARTHKWLTAIYIWLIVAMTLFLASAVLMVWFFVGLDAWHTIDIDLYDLNNDGVLTDFEIDALRKADALNEVIVTRNNQLLIECLNPYDDDMMKEAETFGYVLASLNTFVVFATAVWGIHRFRAFRRSFQANELRRWYAENQARQRKKMEHESKEHALASAGHASSGHAAGEATPAAEVHTGEVEEEDSMESR